MIPNNLVHVDPTGLGLRDVFVNSSIMDEGVTIKNQNETHVRWKSNACSFKFDFTRLL